MPRGAVCAAGRFYQQALGCAVVVAVANGALLALDSTSLPLDRRPHGGESGEVGKSGEAGEAGESGEARESGESSEASGEVAVVCLGPTVHLLLSEGPSGVGLLPEQAHALHRIVFYCVVLC